MQRTTDYIAPDHVHTLHGLFLERISRSPQATAYRYFNKTNETWEDIAWQAMGERVATWKAALAKEQLAAGDRVALMLPNSPEWVCFDMAALLLGLVVVPLFANDRPENIAYILEETGTKVLLCPGLSYWNDLEPVLNRLKNIQRIVTLDFCKVQDEDLRIKCSSEWLVCEPVALDTEFSNGDDVASIVFTSGTTGPPKGVMLSHRNILENSYAGLQTIPIYADDLFLSFLPMSHMLERTVGYYLPVMAGATVAFVRSLPQLREDLQHLQPTALIAVPRVFEKIHAGIKNSLAKKSSLAQRLFTLAVNTGWHRFEWEQKRASWSPLLLLHPLLDKIIAAKVRQQLGGKLRIIISGGAALSPEIAKLFLGLGLPLCQGYGLTETSPVVSVNRMEDNRPSGVGPPLPGIEVKTGKNNELLVRGSCVMGGYWKDSAATAQTMTADGWLRTGDQVVIKDKHIQIIGRLKEIIVLSNSEKVAPVDLEMAITLDPLFEQVMVVGEGRPFLTMVAVLDPKAWAELRATLHLPDSEDSLHSNILQQEVLARVDKCLHSFPGFAWIKQAVLTLEPWTVENELLTPTLKIKREKIATLMQKEIERMYA